MTPTCARRVEPDTGSVTLFLVITVAGLLVMVGLIVDGGARLRAISNAQSVAGEAARAAGQQIARPEAISGRPATVDAERAAAAARAFLAGQHVAYTITLAPDRRGLQIHVHTSTPTVFLALIGINRLDADAQATVALLPSDPGAAP